MLDFACQHFGDAPYLREKLDNGWTALSYRQTRAHVRQLAAALRSIGLQGPGAIVSEGKPAWVIAENALFLCHQFSVPLSIKLSAEEISFRLQHSKAQIVFCTAITADKVIHSAAKLSKTLIVVYLDPINEGFEKLKASYERVYCYDQLLRNGLEILSSAEAINTVLGYADMVKPSDTATVSYTSGTTGNPKGIMLSHANYFHDVHFSLAGFPLRSGLRMFVILPIDHAYAHTIALYAALIKNFSLSFVDARNGAMGLLRNIPINMKEVKPQLMLTVPALTANFMNRIVAGVKEKGNFALKLFRAGIDARVRMNASVFKKTIWYKRIMPWFPAAIAELLVFKKVRAIFGGDLSFCISGGAHLDIKQQEFFKAIGIPVYQGYGLTEAAPVVSTNNHRAHKLGTSGMILPGIECVIRNDAGEILERGKKGQVCLRGKNIMQGYLYNQQATEQALRDDWLYTGDLGFVDQDGFLHVSGREKALLIFEDGEKYSPEEIEDAMVSTSSCISQCMLYCDHKRYTSALISVDIEAIVEKLTDQSKDINAETALELIIKEFSLYNQDSSYRELFPSQWRPVTFAIVPRPFSEAEGMINSTLKMVRHGILKVYQDLIDYQYDGLGRRPTNQKNKACLEELLAKKQ